MMMGLGIGFGLVIGGILGFALCALIVASGTRGE